VDGESAYFPLPEGVTDGDLLQLAELVLRPLATEP
jgi:hypothetical protein